MQENGGGSRDRKDDATSGAGIVRRKDVNSGNTLAAQGFDRLGLGGYGTMGGGVVGLNIDCELSLEYALQVGWIHKPFASSFKEYSAIKERIPLDTPSTSS
jgi:hypothetical protein